MVWGCRRCSCPLFCPTCLSCVEVLSRGSGVTDDLTEDVTEDVRKQEIEAEEEEEEEEEEEQEIEAEEEEEEEEEKEELCLRVKAEEYWRQWRMISICNEDVA